MQLRCRKVKFEDIDAINLEYYYRALHTVGGDPDKPEKWDPQTREDADHSMQLRKSASAPLAIAT